MTKIKIGVIGTINKDSVTLPDGNSYHGWGGILYNLMVLSDELKKHVDIFPVCNIGRDCYAPIMKILKRLPSVKTDLIRRVPERNNHCRLTYHNSETKSEILEGGVPPLRYDHIKGLLNCDAVLLNFISGRDIDLRSLGKFRRRFEGVIYTDIHSYTLGQRSDGRRFLRVPPHWTTVMRYSDIIQMNRLELALLSGLGDNKMIAVDTAIHLFIKRLKLANVPITAKIFLVTDGSHGCYVYDPERNGEQLEFLETTGGKVHGDTTGCGDCFGAGFLAEYIINRNLTRALKTGQLAARNRILTGLLFAAG
jgi:sugar/nucleoside kinase (ribokinase family)